MGYKEEFIEFLAESKALRFGDFTMKSGRKSPYFVNSGMFNTGKAIAKLGEFYAKAITELAPNVHLIFGPSYKGVPLALTASMALSAMGKNVGYAFDRKEAKDHGDMGVLVGMQTTSDHRVVIVDDVVTSGRSIRESFQVLRSQGNPQVDAVLISVDRMEKGKEKNALMELEEEFQVPVRPIVTIREIMEYLHNKEINGEVYLNDQKREEMEAYLKEWCV